MAERRPAGDQAQPTLDQQMASQVFHDSLNSYDELVNGLGIVQASLVGYKLGLRTAFMWNVLSQDFSAEEMADSRFQQLDQATAQVAAETHDYQPLRIANVLPSRLPQLRRIYEEAGFALNLQPFTDEVIGATTEDDKAPLAETDGLDILIGGAETYHQRLQKAREIAAEARTVWREGFEEVFHLNIFDRMRDKVAGVMLKDIVLARNAALKGLGYVRAFELQTEPSSVLCEITGNPYAQFETIDTITALDVTGAIEAGVLKPYFNSQQEYVDNTEHIASFP